MKLNNNISKKQSGFKVPKAYFESFEERMLKKISKKQENTQTALPTHSGFEIPEAYFNTLEKSILDQTVHLNKGKLVNLWYNRIAKIAAVLLILFTVYGILNIGKPIADSGDNFSNISTDDLELYIENNILPYSEMRNLFVTDNEFDVAENNMNELNREVILKYLDNELDDLDLLDE